MTDECNRKSGAVTGSIKRSGRLTLVLASCCPVFFQSLFMTTAAQAQGLQNMPPQFRNPAPGIFQQTYQQPVQSNSFGSNIWSTAANSRVPIGTLLNGVLEDNISSLKSQRGDVFSIRLEDGYFRNGVEVVPRHSRIVGAVTNVTRSLINGRGHPGNLQVSLQTIVFPDGRNTPICGFLVHNPNMDEVSNPKKGDATSSLTHYPSATASSFASVGRNLTNRAVGLKVSPRVKSEDFTMVQGEILAVRLNRSLDLTHMSPPPTGFAPSNLPPDPNNPTINGLSSGQPLLPAPNPITGGGAVAGQSIMQPGMSPVAPGVAGSQYPQPPILPGASPNQIFDNPVGPKPGLNMPDPF